VDKVTVKPISDNAGGSPRCWPATSTSWLPAPSDLPMPEEEPQIALAQTQSNHG